MQPVDPSLAPASPAAYRDPLSAATARLEVLERELAALARENRALRARIESPAPNLEARAAKHGSQSVDRRRALQRKVRAVRRELHAAFGVRRYAASAVLAVTAAAAFIVMAAESSTSWPLAVAILSMGAVARSLVAQWPGFDELEERKQKLASLKSELEELRAHRRSRRAPTADGESSTATRDHAQAQAAT